jgi:histidine triad (HIT) family protein
MVECVFCDLVRSGNHRCVKDCIVFEPLFPVTPGHLLIVPVQHVNDAIENPAVSGQAMMVAATEARLYDSANIITSIGKPATQSVFHLHLHIVPRHTGDGLTLPWTGQDLISS